MLEKNKEFYKLVEKLVGSQFAKENGVVYELDMDLMYIDQLENKEENREVDEYELKDFLDMMVRKAMILVIYALDTLNIMYNINITGFEEENKKEKTEEDIKSEEIIIEKIENRNKRIEEEKGMSRKQRRNKMLVRKRMKRKGRRSLKRKKNK